jgi:aminopeptidase YwaD
MRLINLFSLLFLFITSAVQAQDMMRVRKTIDTLSSPYFHGRGYILDGDAKAAEYIHKRFQEAQLSPIGPSYFQDFHFSVNRITETPQLIIDGRALNAGVDFVAKASSLSGAGRAKVLPLDTLIFTDQKVRERFFSQNFHKKAVVYRYKDIKNLEKLTPSDRHKLQKAKTHIILQPKTLLTSVALEQSSTPVIEVLETAWKADTKKVKFKVKAELNTNHKARNVIGMIEGSAKPDSFIVFTAHYDHLGGQGDKVYFPGANDNASGTAMLLELAEYFSKPENTPRYSIAFISFAAEEAGLLGSTYYVQNPRFPLSQIRFLVNLDLLGTGEEGIMVVNGKVHTSEFNMLLKLNDNNKYLNQIKSRGKAANSDHYPFSEKGIPSFFIYTLGGTAAYHNIQDYSKQLPLTKFSDVFKLITNFAGQLQH